MKKKLQIFFTTIGLLLFAFYLTAQKPTSYQEKYRPQFHFTAKENWINDPNGLIFSKGLYHLFFQHNPFGNTWGHMSWGHATSKDLIHWTQQPLAIAEEKDTMIFSGTTVYDTYNTSGLGTAKQPPMVAIYTGHIENVNQSQHLAYSLDEGTTWTKYTKNPILDLGKKDFRDPKIFWYGPKKYWVMCVSLPLEHQIQFYASTNLLSWQYLSTFGPMGDTTGVWECPDLFELNGTWVLQLSQNAGMQYFLGQFDGVAFTTPSTSIQKPDLGPDYYAAISIGQMPVTEKPTAIGWINNWNYATAIPTYPWKGAMSLPRRFSLQKTSAGNVLMQEPIEDIVQLRKKPLIIDPLFEGKELLSGDVYECRFEIATNVTKKTGIQVLNESEGNQGVVIGYDPIDKKIFLDRSLAGTAFSKTYDSLDYFTVVPLTKKDFIKLRVFVDKSILEVFIDDGAAVITAQAFPTKTAGSIKLYNTQSSNAIKNMQIFPLQSIW